MRALPTCVVGALLTSAIWLLEWHGVGLRAWHLVVGVLLAVPATLPLGPVLGTALLRMRPSVRVEFES